MQAIFEYFCKIFSGMRGRERRDEGGNLSQRARRTQRRCFWEEVSGKSSLCASPRLRVRFFEGSFLGKVQARKEAKDAKVFGGEVFGEFTRIERMGRIKTDFWGREEKFSRGGAEDGETDTV